MDSKCRSMRFPEKTLSLCLLLSLSVLAGGTVEKVAAALQGDKRGTGASATNIPTLAESLTGVPSQEVAIAVSAETVHLPKGTGKPEAGTSLGQIVTDFGYMTRRYGAVLAIAPATMIVINANPGQPNIYQNIPAREAFTFLAASLSDTQRQALISERGLGLPDLTSDMQRNLYMALIPGSSLPIAPRAMPGQSLQRPPENSIENPLQDARLRVGQTQKMVVHSPGSDIMGNTGLFSTSASPRIYDVANQDHLYKQDMVDGVRIRSVVANVPKKSDLNYNLSALQNTIPLRDLKTVGDLIARISVKTPCWKPRSSYSAVRRCGNDP